MAQDTAKKYEFPKEREQLLKMLKESHTIRLQGDFNKPETTLEMSKIDLGHQEQLVKILDKIGLPSTQNIGTDGAEAVWLTAQHATYDIALMRRVLKLMQTTMKKNPENGYHRGIPYLVDRIKVMEGKPQSYGTQFWASPSGKPVPYPIKDPEGIETRRKEFGLRPFKDYQEDIVKASDLSKRPVYHVLY